MATIDHRAAIANRKIHAPANFHWYRWEVLNQVDRSVMMTGCISSGVHEKGKNKGQPRYDGEPVRVVVTNEEFEAERLRYEREEGKCHTCAGDGQAFAGWSATEGSKWRECFRCKGTGQPPSVAAVDPHAGSTGTTSTRDA